MEKTFKTLLDLLSKYFAHILVYFAGKSSQKSKQNKKNNETLKEYDKIESQNDLDVLKGLREKGIM